MRLLQVLAASVLVVACDSGAKREVPAGSASDGKAAAGTPAAPPSGATASPAPGGGGSSAGSAAAAGSSPAGSAAPPRPGAATPASTLAQVQQWAPGGTTVAAAKLPVKGIELFAVSPAKPLEGAYPGGTLVGVAGGPGGSILEGRELVRAAIGARADPKTLARVALWVAQRDAEILDTPITPDQRKARVHPPRRIGKAVVFWVWTRGVPRLVEKGTLDPATGALDLAPPPALHDATILAAMTAAMDTRVSIDTSALQLLAASCTEPRQPKIKAVLQSALGSHPSVQVRAAVADVAHRCGTALIQPLIDAMEHDASGLVRSRAATALGRIGDVRARPALGKAARGEDANVAWAAKNALEKIH